MIYLQFLIAGKLELLGIIPNLITPFVIYINLRLDSKTALPLSFFMGLLYDITYPELLGLHSLSFVILSFLIVNYHHNINKEKFSIVLLSVLLLIFIHHIIFFMYYLVSGDLSDLKLFIFIFSFVFNTLVSLIVIYSLIITDSIRLKLDV